jgi:uncharacterized protein
MSAGLSREDVLEALRRHGPDLRRLGARRIGLFGSIARGEATASSDLDLVVELEPKSFDNYMGVKLFLEDLLGRRVDLVMAETIKPRLRPRILAETVYAEGLPRLP